MRRDTWRPYDTPACMILRHLFFFLHAAAAPRKRYHYFAHTPMACAWRVARVCALCVRSACAAFDDIRCHADMLIAALIMNVQNVAQYQQA